MTARRFVGLLACLGLVFAGACDRLPTEQQRTGSPEASPSFSMHATCQPTGTGLTAKVVNEDVVNGTIDVGDCDIGAFFDEDGTVRNATFLQDDDDGAPSPQYAVLVQGADVDVTGSEVDVVDDFGPQFLGIAYREGATGTVRGNTVTGFHRVGILLSGAGTEANVSRNEVVGVGPKNTGWAENGIQVSSGATATLKGNEVRDHWWDKNNFVSSGILVFGADDVTAHHNTLSGNDAAIGVSGASSSTFGHNDVDVTDADGATSGIFHFGAIVYSAEDLAFVQNEFTSGSPDGSPSFGLWLTGAADNTKLIGNTFDGFGNALVDQGSETKLPSPFMPDS